MKRLEFDKQVLDVCMRVEYLSFSAHADARGIMQLISQCRPGYVLLVHGEASKMEFLKARIECEVGLECCMPANGEIAMVPTLPRCEVFASAKMIKSTIGKQLSNYNCRLRIVGRRKLASPDWEGSPICL